MHFIISFKYLQFEERPFIQIFISNRLLKGYISVFEIHEPTHPGFDMSNTSLKSLNTFIMLRKPEKHGK